VAGPTPANHPQTAFWNDLWPILQTWLALGKQIIVGLDANDNVINPDITKYFHTMGMVEAITLPMAPMHLQHTSMAQNLSTASSSYQVSCTKQADT